jgi:hypothetical protein
MGINARERLRRLSVVFAVELRMKIVIELYMREMSAKQFFLEFGGGSASRVNQNFTRLAKDGWLRYIRSEGPGGNRHGGVERFYRAANLPFIDSVSWALVPFSVRATTTWNFLKQVVPRLRGDLEAKNVGYGRDLSCAAFLLDEEGWKRAAGAASTQFVRLYEEQEDARRRALHSGEELTRADVFLIAFESLGKDPQLAVNDLLVESQREPLAPFRQRLAPILEDDVRLGIVSEVNEREASVTQFHREVGGASKPAVGRRFKGLVRGGWLVKGGTATGRERRGAKEQFYRATKPAARNYEGLCGNPPGPLAGTESWQAFEHLCESATESLTSGAFDARTDRCLSWSLIRLDRQGWENVVADLGSLSDFISQEQERAKLRMAKSGEKPITLTLATAVLKAPQELVKAP